MKTARFSLILALTALCGSVRAQFAVDWFSIDAGSGTSTGGVFSVSGSIGQVVVGTTMTNGQFSATGGFLPVPLAVQTPGAPLLKIIPASPGHVTISWSPGTPGFVLQERLTLSPANWVNSPSGATNPVVVSAVVPAKFYRLFKP